MAATGFCLMLRQAVRVAQIPEKSKVFWFFSSEKNAFLVTHVAYGPTGSAVVSFSTSMAKEARTSDRRIDWIRRL